MRYDPKPEFEKYDTFDGGYVDTIISDIDLDGGTPTTQNKFRVPVNGGNGVEYTECLIAIKWETPSSSNVYPRENWNFECLNPTSFWLRKI